MNYETIKKKLTESGFTEIMKYERLFEEVVKFHHPELLLTYLVWVHVNGEVKVFVASEFKSEKHFFESIDYIVGRKTNLSNSQNN